MYWNLFIRYLFHSALYIQVGAGAVAALIFDAGEIQEHPVKFGISIAIIVLLNSSLFAIFRVLTKYRKKLDTEHNQARFGALYENLNVEYVRRPPLLVSALK